MNQRSVSSPPPHVLVFPFPIQGNVNSMLKLAELLCLAGVHVTFLNCLYSHHRLLSHSNVEARFSRYPGFRFETIPDGLPMDHPRTAQQFLEMVRTTVTTTRPLFAEMLTSWRRPTRPPLTCIIADLLLTFPLDVANDVGLPIFSFCAISACAFWAYFSLPKLIETGQVPVSAGSDMDRLVAGVPGMEGFLRRRDLPGTSRVNDVAYPNLQHIANNFRLAQRAHALILNTFDDLEGPILSQIRDHCPRTYTVGPLHALLKPKSSNSFREEDRSCIPWLDRQPPESVIYVSFGSLAMITKEELTELWQGLVSSGIRFLWAIRPGAVVGVEEGEERETSAELLEGIEEDRGYHVVSWAPQEEVLQHVAVGGFLTHSGWNSTLESLVAGKPMICWPYFADQQINSRFVGHVWKGGIDMKDTWDRITIEKRVRELMEGGRRADFVKAADTMASLAKMSVSERGSSCRNLSCLIQEINLLNARFQ